MSAALLKLIQSGATADVAAAIHDDPGLASCRDPQGVSMLLWSVYYGQGLVRDFLLTQLAASAIPLDIFEASAVGDNAQLHSLLAGDPALVRSFAGDGWTPLHLAAAFSTPETVSMLLDAGAPLDALSRNPQQNQPLHAALALGKNARIITLLLAHGAAVNARQAGGFTPLFSAAIANRKDLAEILLAHGADPGCKSDQGKTSADFARERGHLEIANWLDAQRKPQPQPTSNLEPGT